MTFYIMLFIFLLFCIYCGQVAGLMIHCELSDEFKDVKRYVPMVPFLRIIMFFYCVKDCVKERNIKLFLFYIMSNDKNMMFLLALIESLPQLEAIRKRKEVNRKLRVSPKATLKEIIFDTHSIIEAKCQFM